MNSTVESAAMSLCCLQHGASEACDGAYLHMHADADTEDIAHQRLQLNDKKITELQRENVFLQTVLAKKSAEPHACDFGAANPFDPAHIGRKVRVWWPTFSRWYKGVVDSAHPKRGYFIHYADGDKKYEQHVDLLRVRPHTQRPRGRTPVHHEWDAMKGVFLHKMTKRVYKRHQMPMQAPTPPVACGTRSMRITQRGASRIDGTTTRRSTRRA